jgi:hypothetical protein
VSEIKDFDVVPHPQRAAEQWFELFRSGKREEAAAQVAEVGNSQTRGAEPGARVLVPRAGLAIS